MFLHFKIFIKALVCKIIQLIILEMNVFIVMSKPDCKEENVSPMEIPRDFPRALSRKKNGSKTSLRALSPPWKFLKVDRC